MKKSTKLLLVFIPIVIIAVIIAIVIANNAKTNDDTLRTVKSKSEILKLTESKSTTRKERDMLYQLGPLYLITSILSGQEPSLLLGRYKYYSPVYDYNINQSYKTEDALMPSATGSVPSGMQSSSPTISFGTGSIRTNTEDYSKTNTQVENVDEADIIKTDGKYVYSLTADKIVITNVENLAKPEVIGKVAIEESEYIPEDLVLYNDYLIAIGTKSTTSYSTRSNSTTGVFVYDMKDKKNLYVVKEFEIAGKYNTCRVANGKFSIIVNSIMTSKYSNVKEEDLNLSYYENSSRKNIDLNNVQYIANGERVNYTTDIMVTDLDNITKDANVYKYLFDMENAYVSENAIYLADQTYDRGQTSELSPWSIFGPKGIFGLRDAVESTYYNSYSTSTYKTRIYKLSMKDDKLEMVGKLTTEGKLLDQYSMDEKDGNLRVALNSSTKGDNQGTRIEVYDQSLKLIGKSVAVEPDEKMYASRFIGDKAYLVTYKNMDPLFVVDLADPTNPKFLGKLNISGYSTYLHPYDENHLIGIGMETETTPVRNSSGRVTTSTTRITGMKIALFDISNFQNPKVVSTVKIGDSGTSSAALNNPKAMLFDLEHKLIAIPVTNIPMDLTGLEENDISELMSTYSSSYKKYYQQRDISEGYAVFSIDAEEGIKQRAIITHNFKINYSNYKNSSCMRGVRIGDYLITVSAKGMQVNDIATLSSISELDFTTGGQLRNNKIITTDPTEPDTNTTNTVDTNNTVDQPQIIEDTVKTEE
jgi:uncharacterized secreted protein with C-terminal beta-propeller domain